MSRKLQKIYAWILTIGSFSGLVAMVWQASERVTMLKNPEQPLSCNLNPIVDCGIVLSHRLSALFGFPNAFIGISVFSALLLSGLVLLTNNKPNRALKHIMLALSSILMLFSMWFFASSLYFIGKICIFCVVGWIASVPIFIYTLYYWLEETHKKSRVFKFLQSNHMSVVVTWYVIMLALFFARFKDYYFG